MWTETKRFNYFTSSSGFGDTCMGFHKGTSRRGFRDLSSLYYTITFTNADVLDKSALPSNREDKALQ